MKRKLCIDCINCLCNKKYECDMEKWKPTSIQKVKLYNPFMFGCINYEKR